MNKKQKYLLEKDHRVEIRKILLLENGDRCWICNKPFSNLPTIDHIIPKAYKGKLSLENSRLAHKICNRNRGIDSSQLKKVERIIKCSIENCDGIFKVWGPSNPDSQIKYENLCAACQRINKFPWTLIDY